MRAVLVLALALLAGGARAAPAALVPAAPAVVATNPAPSLTVPVGYTLTLSWGAVTTYTTGAPLTSTPDYKLYSMNNPAAPGFIGYLGNVLATAQVMQSAGTQCYAVTAQIWSPAVAEGPKSSTICVLVQAGPPPAGTPPAAPSPVCVK
jgi:hypothetical protein